MSQVVLTQIGLEKLQHELEDLRTNRRPGVIERIRHAKEYGDLSENSEYEDAKNEQSFVEGRIQELEAMLKAAVITHHQKGSTLLEIGSVVDLVVDGQKLTYEIVGANESDPANGKISAESPLGQALLGAKASQTIKVVTPDETLSYTIKAVR